MNHNSWLRTLNMFHMQAVIYRVCVNSRLLVCYQGVTNHCKLVAWNNCSICLLLILRQVWQGWLLSPLCVCSPLRSGWSGLKNPLPRWPLTWLAVRSQARVIGWSLGFLPQGLSMWLDWASDKMVLSWQLDLLPGSWLQTEPRLGSLGSLKAEPWNSVTSAIGYQLKQVIWAPQVPGGKGAKTQRPEDTVHWKHQSNLLSQWEIKQNPNRKMDNEWEQIIHLRSTDCQQIYKHIFNST